MKHIVLNGGYTMGSAGDDAPLEVITRLVAKKINDPVRFTVLARHPNEEFDNAYNVRSIKNLEYDSKSECIGRWLRGFNPDDSINEVEEILKLYENADLLILGAGNFINENSKGLLKGLLPRFYIHTWLADWANLPVMLFGLSSSRIHSTYAKFGAQWLFKRVSVITFREEFAPKNLIESGIIIPDYKVFPDPVLAMKELPENKEVELYKKEEIPLKASRRLAVSIRNMAHIGVTKEEEYYSNIAIVIEQWLTNNKNGDVVFIPQFVYDVDGPIDDIGIATKIISLINNELHFRIYSVKGKYLPWEIEAFYRNATEAITTRLHATLFALRVGVPTVAIAYETKVKGLLKNLEYPESLMMHTNSSFEEIYSKLSSINVDFNENVRKKIKLNIIRSQKQIDSYGDIAIRTIK